METMNPKPDTISALIKKADEVYSLFIRLRDCDKGGSGTCFICGAQTFWRSNDKYKSAQCMHLNPRKHHATRYDEECCFSGCYQCNNLSDNHRAEFERAIIDISSMDHLNDLLQRKHSFMKYTRHELEELIEHYEQKVKELKKLKGV